MWKFLIFALIGFALYKMLVMDRKKTDESKENKSKENKSEKMYAQGKMAKDPICGAYVAVNEDGIKVRDGETVYRFCSYECRDAFLRRLQESGREIPVASSKDEDDE